MQVQAIRLLSSLAQKPDLLYDILNCQVRQELTRGGWIPTQMVGKEETRILQTDSALTRLSLCLFLPLSALDTLKTGSSLVV